MLLVPGNCRMLPNLRLPNGGYRSWPSARMSIFPGLQTSYGVRRLSFNQLFRYFFTEGMQKRRGKESVSAGKLFSKLTDSLDLILNTRKILLIMSEDRLE